MRLCNSAGQRRAKAGGSVFFSTSLLVGLLIGSGLLGGAAWAEDYAPLWARGFGDAAAQKVNGVAVDDLGRVVIAGHFAGSIDLGSGTHVSAGGLDIFVAKFEPDGTCLWSRSFGGSGTQVAMDVACDPAGSVYVAGYFENSVDFGGGPLTSAGGFDAFLVKLDPYNGAHYWSHGYGVADTQVGAAVAADANKVYLTGYFKETVDFGGGTLTSAGLFDVFLVQFDNGAGVHMWSDRFGDASTQIGRGIDLHPTGKVAITGEAGGVIDFGGGPLASAGQTDVFVAKFNSFGYHEWSALYGDGDTQEGTDIAFHGYYQDLVATGRFYGSIDLGGGPLASAGDLDTFLAEFDTNGAHLWSRRCGGPQATSSEGVSVGSLGQIALTGYFEGTADFGTGPLTSSGGRDVFLATYDTNGIPQFSANYGNTVNQAGKDIEFDATDRLLVGGDFKGAVDFGTGPLVSAGDYDVFLAMFDPLGSGAPEVPDVARADLCVWPNPVGPATTVRYTLGEAGWVRLSLHDIQGRCLGKLVDGFRDAGTHRAPWPLEAPAGAVLFLQLDVNGERQVGKALHLE